MPIPLPTLTTADPDASWAAFLARRETLAQTMHLDVCNGCDECGTRCTDGIVVTRAEWDAVRAHLAALPAAAVARVLGQEKTVPWAGAEETGATVTVCPFRDTESNNCFVYDARPTVCRLMGQTTWLPCPIEAVPHYPEDAAPVWNAYRRFERKGWREWAAETGEIGTADSLLP